MRKLGFIGLLGGLAALVLGTTAPAAPAYGGGEILWDRYGDGLLHHHAQLMSIRRGHVFGEGGSGRFDAGFVDQPRRGLVQFMHGEGAQGG